MISRKGLQGMSINLQTTRPHAALVFPGEGLGEGSYEETVDPYHFPGTPPKGMHISPPGSAQTNSQSLN